MYKDKIQVFYQDKLVSKKEVGFSKSPNKPKLLLDWIRTKGLTKYFEIQEDWKPFSSSEFFIAHDKKYVDDFFSGKPPLASSNGLSWNPQFAESVKYTNASLYHAIKNSIDNPTQISFSPTSGFHHARPDKGGGFCTFSGQVIASMKIWNEYKISGCYLDMDGHYGNSIEDSRVFCSDLKHAIPPGFNINPSGYHKEYIKSLEDHLHRLKRAIATGQIRYVVVCSGADSLEDDDLGGQLSLHEWVHCKQMIYIALKETADFLGKPVPLTISLFGGYRKDDYNSVLDAHTQDLIQCLNIVSLNKIDNYKSEYVTKKDMSQNK